ncbi:MAG: glycosyltransferase family 4 protein [Chromatiaceae bacterium]|nr:glycosyltransferase family 4 protein [Chromatiaceae bacterium]MCF7994147.1 glycosyltransferase family 4 protein [Chromatiaceae bacterium]MCF8016100.1 glycosyltransferase family 4 protein [Chromatiaceae bacterium]
MQVIQLNHSDINGGAARAAYRIHHCLRDAGVDSRMWVNKATAGDWTVQGPSSKWEKLTAALRGHVGGQLRYLLKTGNPIIHSPAVVPSQWVKRLNASDADIVHLHWVQDEMLSIAEIGRIEKPIVWTLHDMWAFCGAEHYTDDHRYRDGYHRDNRPAHEARFDLNRWTWQRKRKHWQRPLHIVTPSQWLADCARASVLMRDWPVSVVANPIDTERWQPLPQGLARELLGLPAEVPLLLFGAMGGGRDPRKGFDLLLQALELLHDDPGAQGLELVIFGQRAPQSPPSLGFPIHYSGHLHDDLSLRALYSAADAMVIPSRQDNLPNTGVEAHACATPVIAFNTGGLPDIVAHQRTGYLAKAFETDDLARGIAWVLAQRETGRLGEQARERAVERFTAPVVAEHYQRVYAQAAHS